MSTPKEIWGQFTRKAKESAGSTIKPGFTLNHDSNRPTNPPPVLENTEWPLLHIASDAAGDRTGRLEGAGLSRREIVEQWLRCLSPGEWVLCAHSLGLDGSTSKYAVLDGFAFDESFSDESSSPSDESAPAKSIFDDSASNESTFADSISEGSVPDDDPGFNDPAPSENDYAFEESAIDAEDFYLGALKVGSKKTRSNKFPKDHRRRVARRIERSGGLRMERRRQNKRV